jgi:hypothetical protein
VLAEAEDFRDSSCPKNRGMGVDISVMPRFFHRP